MSNAPVNKSHAGDATSSADPAIHAAIFVGMTTHSHSKSHGMAYLLVVHKLHVNLSSLYKKIRFQSTCVAGGKP